MSDHTLVVVLQIAYTSLTPNDGRKCVLRLLLIIIPSHLFGVHKQRKASAGLVMVGEDTIERSVDAIIDVQPVAKTDMTWWVMRCVTTTVKYCVVGTVSSQLKGFLNFGSIDPAKPRHTFSRKREVGWYSDVPPFLPFSLLIRLIDEVPPPGYTRSQRRTSYHLLIMLALYCSHIGSADEYKLSLSSSANWSIISSVSIFHYLSPSPPLPFSAYIHISLLGFMLRQLSHPRCRHSLHGDHICA